MANLPESPTWEEGVYQLETTDPVLAGPEGIANAQAKALANRTNWLKAQLDSTVELLARQASAVRPILVSDQYDRVHNMVFVPRFRLPANSIGSWPSAPVEFGGFLLDQYAASHPNATPAARGVDDNPTVEPGSVRACSTPGVVPWTNITRMNARQACANREIWGAPCRLMRPEDWAAIQLLSLANEHPRGNTSAGRDARDLDQWDSYGIADPTNAGGRTLVGSGPIRWSHNGLAEGVVDWLGNVAMLLDMDVDAGRYLHWLDAQLDDTDGISDTDTAMVISGVQSPELWPSSGLVLIDDEYVAYSSFADNENGTYTLGGLVRARLGTTAAAHDDEAPVALRTDFCLVPSGASAFLSTSIDTTDPITFSYNQQVPGPGSGSDGFAVGRYINIDGEVLLITAATLSGATGSLTCSRAQWGSNVGSHAGGRPITMRAPTADVESETLISQSAYIHTMRSEPMIERLGLPATWGNEPGAFEDLASFSLRGVDTFSQLLARGGAFNRPAQRGWWLWHQDTVGGEANTGFRAVRPLEQV